jgi:chitin deacetylase
MPSISSIVFAVSALAAAVYSHPISHDHEHVERGALPAKWFQESSHPSSRLFRRQGAQLPQVGSAEWTAKYPTPNQPLNVDEASIPAAWVAAYKAAVANGLIPAIAPTVVYQDGDYNTKLVYPDGSDPASKEVCSTYVQCYNETDIVNSIDGAIGISFDDGPAPGSKLLYDFLGQNHIKATHFLIGQNIVSSPDLFTQAFKSNGDMAVHTYTHAHMTAQSDLGVLAELGWTMQVIHDSTGGRVPRFWRPPYGEMDQRVRAIAEHIFGLTAVMWNQDTNDWGMPDYQNAAQIAKDMETWMQGPKSPGLMILEHELTDDTSGVFINTTWPLAQKYGWKPMSVGQMYGKDGWNYANAKDNTSPVQAVTGVETAQTSTGTVALPAWYSGLATTSTVSSLPADAPTSAPAPAPPSTDAPKTDAPAPENPAPAPSQTSSSSSSSSTPGVPTPGGGGAATPDAPAAPAPSGNTKPPLTTDGTNQQLPASQNSETQETSNETQNAAGLLRPQFAFSAIVAAVAFVLFA